MYETTVTSAQLRTTVFVACLTFTLLVAPTRGQIPNSTGLRSSTDSVKFRVQDTSQRLEMVVDTSRILTLDEPIPRVLVNNTEVANAKPISASQVQVSAISPGVTQINLWDQKGEVHSVDVIVFADARQLEMVLHSEFPHAAVRVRPLASSVVLTGFVDKPETVSRIVRIAEDYYPKVINNISVSGAQQVALHVKVMEVSRTKLRSIGFDWGYFNGGDYIVQSVSGLVSAAASGAGGIVGTGNDTIRFGIVSPDSGFFGFLDALRQYNLVKVLAEPTLTSVSGRPARFNAGGEFPVIVPQALDTVSIEFKRFGTSLDFVPIVLGNGNIRLEIRPEVSEIDNSRALTVNGYTVPGLRVRSVDTAVEMRAGQVLALAGLIQTRVESENRGLPWLADLPWAGAAFRRVKENVNEVELLILVRPELVDAVDPHLIAGPGPGEQTVSPDDCDFYWKGHMEVPRCGPIDSCFTNSGSAFSEGIPAGAYGPVNGLGVEGAPASGPVPMPTSRPGYESFPPQVPAQPAIPQGGALPAAPPADAGVAVPQGPAWSVSRVSPVGANRPSAVVLPASAPFLPGSTAASASHNSYEPQKAVTRSAQGNLRPYGPTGYDKLH